MTTIMAKGSPLELNGKLPAVGSKAPDFVVTKTDLSEIRLKNYLGKKVILNIFPSLDTPTCATAMVKFNEIASQYPDVLILCISIDLPFAQERFCTAKHLNNISTVSVFRHPGFGKDYGLMITNGPLAGLLARAVVMIDEQGKVIYTELVEELSNEPNYTAVVSALKKEPISEKHT